MKDFANDVTEMTEDLALVKLAEDKPVIVNPQEEAAGILECEHCGHQPCGCGG